MWPPEGEYSQIIRKVASRRVWVQSGGEPSYQEIGTPRLVWHGQEPWGWTQQLSQRWAAVQDEMHLPHGICLIKRQEALSCYRNTKQIFWITQLLRSIYRSGGTCVTLVCSGKTSLRIQDLVISITGSLWRRQSQQSFNTLTPFNFLFYSLYASAHTGHPQVRYTISYYFCFEGLF
jgi:hypothetical protein